MAEKIASEHRKQITALTLVPDGGGCFEVTVDGGLIYSKLETKEFPSESAIVKQLGEMLA
ncbi:Rdx family protein [Planctomycetes bacterium K23_9]|uniref:Rdx family protein n=1 Tax=Stieleria marina TaxID=1930275 RepID=UPI0011A8B0D6